jgi:hypothetical protein
MESTPLRFEDRLDGASNLLYWKEIVTLALKEYEIWELVEKLVTPPTYPTYLAIHQKKEIKVERVLLDSVKVHLIPHVSEKKTSKEKFDSLVGLFHITNYSIDREVMGGGKGP